MLLVIFLLSIVTSLEIEEGTSFIFNLILLIDIFDNLFGLFAVGGDARININDNKQRKTMIDTLRAIEDNVKSVDPKFTNLMKKYRYLNNDCITKINEAMLMIEF